MPEIIEHYKSPTTVQDLRAHALKAWALGLSIAFIWVLLILLAPAAQSNGLIVLSGMIYKFFSFLCHQMADRSFHFFEHQFAVCSRCFGVYFGLLFGFLVYPLIRKIEEVEPFPRIWLFLSIIPIGIDWSLGVFGIWDNNHLSRFSTGLILGTACAIFIIPAIVELAQLLSQKRKVRTITN